MSKTPDEKKEIPFNELVEGLEKKIQSGEGDQLEIVLQAIIDAGNSLKDAGLRHRGIGEASITHHYTRFASVITHVITSYDQAISLQRYESICWRKQDISYIFAVSGYRGMAHLVNLSSSRNEDGSLSLKRNRAMLLLAFLDIDHLTSELLDFAFIQNPSILFPLMIGWISQRAILTERGENNRTRILQAGHLIEDVQIEDRHLPMISVAYMYITYANYDRKHDFKVCINKICQNLLSRRGLGLSSISPPKRKKPVLLVIHEWFSHSHAMYRCFSPLIKALQKNFDLISMASPEGIDNEAAKIFKKSYIVEPLKGGIPGILKVIDDIKPDAIFYPSVGMAYWVILLANMKLAPVQFAGQGHPATTRSDFIDFVYVGRPGFSHPELYSEDVIVSNAIHFEPHAGLEQAIKYNNYRIDKASVDIAINSKLMKINHRLLKICCNIGERSRLPVKFHFFPGERGFGFDGIHQSLKTLVPNAEIYPLMNYESLLQKISECDLALSPMPFGNTNSTIDVSLLGIPSVYFNGKELSSQTDASVIEKFNGPQELLHDSDDEYTNCAIKLINDLDFRWKIRNSYNRDKIYSAIYSHSDASDLELDASAIFNKYSSLAYLK